jgi:hypothetical protein
MHDRRHLCGAARNDFDRLRLRSRWLWRRWWRRRNQRRTIEFQRANLLQKVDAKNTVNLVRKVLRE